MTSNSIKAEFDNNSQKGFNLKAVPFKH